MEQKFSRFFCQPSHKFKILNCAKSIIQIFQRNLYDLILKENMDTRKNPGLSNSIVEFYRYEYFNFAHCVLKKNLWLLLNDWVRARQTRQTPLRGRSLKFVFFEKATKFDEIFIQLLTNNLFFYVSRPILNFSVSYSCSLSVAPWDSYVN